MKTTETKIILDIDSPTRSQLKRSLDYHRHGSILLPVTIFICGGCGKPEETKKAEKYFGDNFCAGCVERWKAGY